MWCNNHIIIYLIITEKGKGMQDSVPDWVISNFPLFLPSNLKQQVKDLKWQHWQWMYWIPIKQMCRFAIIPQASQHHRLYLLFFSFLHTEWGDFLLEFSNKSFFFYFFINPTSGSISAKRFRTPRSQNSGFDPPLHNLQPTTGFDLFCYFFCCLAVHPGHYRVGEHLLTPVTNKRFLFLDQSGWLHKYTISHMSWWQPESLSLITSSVSKELVLERAQTGRPAPNTLGSLEIHDRPVPSG